MRLAVYGKGGSGKTTLTAALLQFLNDFCNFRVLGIDGDHNLHLAHELGATPTDLDRGERGKALDIGNDLGWLRHYFAGNNPRITEELPMIKTTPPGEGSRLLRLSQPAEWHERYGTIIDGVELIRVGDFTKDDYRKKCFHSKTGAIEIFLKHVWEEFNEAIIVDMSAGKDVFASPLPSLFDGNLYVVRPTRKSVTNAKDFLDHARNFGISMLLVATDIRDQSEIQAIENVLAWPVDAAIPHDEFFVQRDSLLLSRPPHIREASFSVLDAFYSLTDLLQQLPGHNWNQLLTRMLYHHEETANDWAGDRYIYQIQPGFNPFEGWRLDLGVGSK
jgi:CO dehydrogenase maturation factor